MNIVFYGTPGFAVPSLDILFKNGFHLSAVVTAPDKPAGRGRKIIQSAVKQWALANHVTLLQPANLSDPLFINQLAAFNPDLQVVVAFRFLPVEVWSLPPLGTFNLHASLLPQYRGAAPINWAIINGETSTGLTTFFLDNRIDTGKIIFQETIDIDPDDDAGILHDKLMWNGAKLVLKTVRSCFDGKIKVYGQNEVCPPDITLKSAPKLNREMAKVKWDQPAASICNLIRGLAPYPAAYSNIEISGNQSCMIKIFKVHISDFAEESAPGTVSTDLKRYFRVKTADAWLDFISVQPEGRKPQFISEFLSGLAARFSKNSADFSALLR